MPGADKSRQSIALAAVFNPENLSVKAAQRFGSIKHRRRQLMRKKSVAEGEPINGKISPTRS